MVPVDEPLSERPDGLLDRERAAMLCDVSPDAITAWVRRGHLPVVSREGRSPLFDPLDVARAEAKTRERARRIPRWMYAA